MEPSGRAGEKMNFAKPRSGLFCLALSILLLGAATGGRAESALPGGLIFNLDLQHIEDGLIPCKTPYPLYVPLDGLETAKVHDRTLLLFTGKAQGLDIPHSILLDPDGRGWVVSLRFFPVSDGVVLTQSNGKTGYAIRVEDGAVRVSIQTGNSTVLLKESKETGITPCLGKWTQIDLEIRPAEAILSINRIRAATIPLPAPLDGKDMRIRLGGRADPPEPGFSGAIASLKILRQQ